MKSVSEKKVDEWLSILKPGIGDYCDKIWSHDDMVHIVAMLFDATGTKKAEQAQVSAAASSICHLLDKNVTRSMLLSNITRLLANWHFIREGLEVPEWTGEEIVVDVVVIGVTRPVHKENTMPTMTLKVKLKTGLIAGIIQWMVLPITKIDWMLSKSGTAKLNCPPEEIAGMKFRLTVSDKKGTLKVVSVDTTGLQREHNKKLAMLRIDQQKCRFRQLPCGRCDADISTCSLAVWLPASTKQQGDEK